MVAAAMLTSSLWATVETGNSKPGSSITVGGVASIPGGAGVTYPPFQGGGGSMDLVLPPPPPVTGSGGPLGINLSFLDYSMVEWPFVDVMKGASGWVPQYVSGGPWNTGEYLATTADDYPLLAQGQAAATIMFVDLNGHYPGGAYKCFYDGSGTLEFGNDANIVSQSSGVINLDVNPTNAGILMRVVATNQNNPIRNIRIIMPGHANTYQSQPFNPTFLDKMSKYSVIRFMDWQRTNNSSQQNWSNRPKPTDRTQASGKGASVEVMVQLCNTLGADAWFCMPHKATDDYIQQFATLVKNSLNPGLKIYIEHSNETWNNGFEQAGYCQQQGLAAGLSGEPYLAQVRWHSKRSVEIFEIWKNVFGAQADARLVRVLAGQHDNPWVSRQIMDYNNAYLKADALAVAPYFGSNLGWPSVAGQTAAMSVEQILAAAQQNIVSRRAYTNEAFADTHSRGLELIAYEGGQHLVGVGEASNNQTLTNKFIEANRHPLMKNLYLEDLYGWVQAGGGMFVAYSSAGRYGQWGSWGVMEKQDQPRIDAPKYDALLTFIEGYEGEEPAGDPLLGDLVSDASFLPPPDGMVNGSDLAFLLSQWGLNPGSAADIVTSSTFLPPGDGFVDSADLAVMLSNWSL